MSFLLPFAQFTYFKTDIFQLLLVTFYKVFFFLLKLFVYYDTLC